MGECLELEECGFYYCEEYEDEEGYYCEDEEYEDEEEIEKF